jgi:hypothetical protein
MSFTFNSYEQETTVVVKADSGKKQVWTVCLKKVKLTDDPSQTDPDTWERMHPCAYEPYFSATGTECSYFAVDSEPVLSWRYAQLRLFSLGSNLFIRIEPVCAGCRPRSG